MGLLSHNVFMVGILIEMVQISKQVLGTFAFLQIEDMYGVEVVEEQ